MSELKVIDLGNIRESIEKGESVYYEYYPKSEADKVIAEKEAENDSLLQQNHEICEALSVMYSREEYNQLKVENERLKAQIEEIEHELHRMRIRYECEG